MGSCPDTDIDPRFLSFPFDLFSAFFPFSFLLPFSRSLFPFVFSPSFLLPLIPFFLFLFFFPSILPKFPLSFFLSFFPFPSFSLFSFIHFLSFLCFSYLIFLRARQNYIGYLVHTNTLLTRNSYSTLFRRYTQSKKQVSAEIDGSLLKLVKVSLVTFFYNSGCIHRSHESSRVPVY